jgi:Bardet-Biedl syndrome 1 protein
MMDVDYRILVCSRDGQIFTINNGDVSGKVIELFAPPIGMVAVSSKEIYIGETGRRIHCFSLRGKKSFTLEMPANITNMTLFSKGRMSQDRALLVALDSGEVRIYKDKYCLDKFHTSGVVTAMRCGRYGREDVCLALTHRSGAISIRVFRRKSVLSTAGIVVGPPPEQDEPLKVPKKTKLYVEQTQREKEMAVEMHRIFQRDLSKLRLTSARSYVKLITDGNGPVSYSRHASVRLTVEVIGLGPIFKLALKVQNTGKKTLYNVPVTFGYKHSLYEMPQPSILIPALVPELLYHYEVVVHSVHANGAAGVVRVFVLNRGSSLPIITASVQMPMSEVMAGGG